jgi:hypothetical protein
MTLTGTSDTLGVHPFENSPGYPGWRVAIVCQLGVFTGFATVFIYSFSFMIQSLRHEFGWNSEQVARETAQIGARRLSRDSHYPAHARRRGSS